MATKSVLGKGLASLLPGHPQTEAASVVAQPAQDPQASNKDRHPGISLAQLDEIVVSPFQPRREFNVEAIEELAQSIRSNGIIQPLVVRRTAEGYELIAGERRLRAARAAGLKQVPIVVRRSTDREALELALIENVQRQDLNCVETALAYFQLSQDFSLTQEEIAARVGKERATVANHLRLLRLSEEILEDLKKGDLSFGHGKALLSLEDHLQRTHVRNQILANHLSVRDTEALIESLKQEAQKQEHVNSAVDQAGMDLSAAATLKRRFRQIATELTHRWSTRVEVKGGDEKGKIVLHYHSRGDLDRLLAQLQGEGSPQ